jgi:hypothetical protein
MKTRSMSVVFGSLLIGLVATVGMPAASGRAGPSGGRPVIGKPVAAPSQPLAGKRFTVSFRVTRSDTKASLKSGTMMCDPSIGGKVITHTESFRGGTARLSFLVPANAAGKLLKVKVTIKAAGRSTARVVSYRIGQVALPSLSIADASVAEGSSGTTTLSFPVTLSAVSTQTVSVGYATADATATAGSDYQAATGTLTFDPGETEKEIEIRVNGDTIVEPDETLTIAMSAPVNSTVGAGTATGTIVNDDVLRALGGTYCGFTDQGKSVCLDVAADGTEITRLVTESIVSCTPDLAFSHTFDGKFASGDAGTYSVEGTFDAAGNVSGRLALTSVSFDEEGTHYTCTGVPFAWSAKRGA